MKIANQKVVQMHYKLTDNDNNIIDSSEGREPLSYIHGMGNLIVGLEKELTDKEAGDKINAVVSPEEGYGERNEELMQVVPKSGFQGDEELQIGMQVQVGTAQGTSIASVAKIDGDNVTLDMNHPLAGVTLNFDVEIVSVREASKEELDHGHVHGPGGHQH
ncbi:MAG: peptidylprolyl isomerase [Bacteroidota bacterium]